MCPLLPPTTCVLWPFPACSTPLSLLRGVPQVGARKTLSVTSDKDPLDSLPDPIIPRSSHNAGVGGCQVYMYRQCYFRFIAISKCVLVRVCVCPHSCCRLLMWPISLHACSCLCIRIDGGCFPRSVCVLIEAISWRVRVCLE